MGHWYTDTLSKREVDYLIFNEWALTADDVLWRRTKQGLYINEQQQRMLGAYISQTAPRFTSECVGPALSE